MASFHVAAAYLYDGGRRLCRVYGGWCQECASAAFVAQREKRVPPADASQSGIAGKDEPDGGVVFFYFVCIFLCWLALMCMGIGLEESFGLSVSSIGNVGPGLGAFGPAFSWSALPDLAKWLLSFMMLIGRLELFGVLLLLTPSFWDRR